MHSISRLLRNSCSIPKCGVDKHSHENPLYYTQGCNQYSSEAHSSNYKEKENLRNPNPNPIHDKFLHSDFQHEIQELINQQSIITESKAPRKHKNNSNKLIIDKDLDIKIETQIKNEIEGYIEVDNIIPEKFADKNNMNSNIYNQVDSILKEWEENIIKRVEYNSFTLRNDVELIKYVKVLTPERFARIILEECSQRLFLNKSGIPTTNLVMWFGGACIRRMAVSHYSNNQYYHFLHKAYNKFVAQNIHSTIMKTSYTSQWQNIYNEYKKDIELLVPFPTFRRRQIAYLGIYCLKLFIESSPVYSGRIIATCELIKDKRPLRSEQKYRHVISAIRIMPEFIEKFQLAFLNKKKINIPTHEIPSIVPCLPRYSYKGGGYLTDIDTPILRGRVDKHVEARFDESLRKRGLNTILDSMTGAGLVGWRINKYILDFMLTLFQQNWNSKELILYSLKDEKDIIDRFKSDVESPRYLTDSLYANKVNDAMRKYKNEQYSLWCNLHKNLIIANHYRDLTFYIPYNMDFRGRSYPVPNACHHYNSDNFRALLMFDKEKPLGEKGLYWLRIHLTNKIGLKKNVTRADRIKYCNDNIKKIRDAAKSPFQHTWWMSVDEPWQALAACIEINNAMESSRPDEYMCSLPIHQDGSCNGLQHYAALGRNKEEASLVHLQHNQEYKDIYTEVAEIVKLLCQKDAELDCEIHDDIPFDKKEAMEKNCILARRFLPFIDRKLVKQTVMTYVYGVTQFGATEQIRSKLEDLAEFDSIKDQILIWEGSKYLSKKVIKSVEKIFHSGNKIMKWLRVAVKPFNQQNIPASWLTPLLLPVFQPYYKDKDLPVSSELGQLRIMTDDDDSETLQLKKLKQKTAMPPNFIHSLDATHMILTHHKCMTKGIVFTAVHDSFWSHPSDIDLLNITLREEFIKMYNTPILENFAVYIKNVTGEDIHESIPLKGDFDLNKINDSENFFS